MELAFKQITMAGRGSRCDLSEKRVIVVLRVFAERWRAEVAESQVEVAFDRDRGLELFDAIVERHRSALYSGLSRKMVSFETWVSSSSRTMIG